MYLHLTLWSLFIIGAIGVEEVVEETLVLVHAVVRHGHRTPDPIGSFPNDLYKNVSYYPYGTGELNQKGIRSTYKLGKELRKRYNAFLGPKYYPEMLEATSSGATRCRMTMQLLLAAMFPPDPSQTFQDGLAWQPIAYQYTDKKTDPMLYFGRCLPLTETLERNEEISKCENPNYMNRYLSEKSGTNIKSLLSVFHLQDTIKSEVENGLNPPVWAEHIWPEPLSTCAADYWRNYANNKSMLGTTGGVFVKKIFDDTNEKIKENSSLEKRKLFLYNLHENSITMFLAVLGNYNGTTLNYLTYILFEVHKIHGVYGLKVYWDNRDEAGLRQLEIPKCGTFCPIDSFYELMKFYINSEPCPL